MPVTFLCPTCGHHINAPNLPGKFVNCAGCGRSTAIPGTPEPEPVFADAAVVTDAFKTPAEPDAKPCPFCGESIRLEAKKCRYCGEVLDPVLLAAGRSYGGIRRSATDKRILPAFLLCFFLGTFGAHRFYVGQTGSGLAMLLLFVLGFPAAFVVVGFFMIFAVSIWAFVDMILILCGSFKDGAGNRITEWT